MDTITGYQYGANNLYIGEYHFPKNKDSDVVHVPPNTTLVAPLKNVPVDQEMYWNGTEWLTRRITMDWIFDREVQVGT